ncbi:hypothetical protein Hanom_Chr06g00523361 [Helianthus anomalus]
MILKIRVTQTPPLHLDNHQLLAAESTQIAALAPHIESTQGTSGGALEEIQKLESSFYVERSLACTSTVLSSADIALQVVHLVSGGVLEEGELVADLTDEQILALNEMKAVEDVVVDQIPSEPEISYVENLEEIVFEGDNNKSTYVQEDGTEFTPFNEDWLKENVDDISEHLKNRDTTDNPPEAQVDYLKCEKENLHGKILCRMFVKEIHCMAIKREHGIQYFKSLPSIHSLPFYDVAALTKLELINRSKFEGATLFARKLKINRRIGWKDELYKPEFPIDNQIKYTLDPSINTTRYKLVYQSTKVMDEIPLMPMKQNFLESMALWCYDSDRHEAVIVFKDNQENFRMLDPMWIVNMSAADINKLFRHDIFYEDKDAHQALRFQRVACLCYYRGIHVGSTWSEKH